MSTYVREKVLRIPFEKLNLAIPEKCDDYHCELENMFPQLFEYACVGKFQISPTCEFYIDYVLDYEYDAGGEYGKIRELTNREKEKYRSIFQQLDPDLNMDFVRLVEFCWYNGCEAPDYYELADDPFYDEV